MSKNKKLNTIFLTKTPSVYIIAEAGVNHNGRIEIALEMIRAAKKCGADCIKFQTFKAEKLVTKNAKKAKYQMLNTISGNDQFTMLKSLEFNFDQYKVLINECRKLKIDFICSPFDLDSVDTLNKLGIEIIKIPSGEITNLPYLRKIGSLRKNIILSTGMATIGEIEFALNTLIDKGTQNKNIIVLHCNTEYPTPYQDVNLNAMLTIKNAFNINIGYSDHTPGIEVPIAAAALGARVIEKHFTIDKTLEGPDHKASLNQEEFKMMVKGIRIVEKALGDGIKQPSPSEIKNIDIVRKYIVAAQPIKRNELFTEKNITVKRAQKGISAVRWDEIISRKAIRSFKEDELIEI